MARSSGRAARVRGALGRTELGRIYRNVKWVRVYRGLSRRPIASVHFILSNHETDNFTYDLENVDELSSMLAHALGFEEARVRRVIAELEDDEATREDLRHRLRARGHRSRRPAYGRRLGWYAVARLTRPALIVETGIHEGIGSAVLLRAFKRNAADGAEGRLLAFDIREDVGWLVADRLRDRYDVYIGDTKTQLSAAVDGRSVDMFVHDSDHTYEHETFELETVLRRASSQAALISDNAHGSAAFADFCARHALQPWIFRERPRRHMYPGAALGLTVVNRNASEA